MVQPTGHAHQIPVAPSAVRERTIARTTLRIRSVKVEAMNLPIRLAPRRIPSATSLADTTK